MPNKTRNKENQTTTGKGKKRGRFSGESKKPNKRSEGDEAQRDYPEGDYGAIAREEGSTQRDDEQKDNARRHKTRG